MTGIVAAEIDTPFTFTLPTGMAAAIQTARDLENEAIVRLLLGFQLPESGTMTVAAVEPGALTENQVAEFRKKIGVIYHDGGLISNLDVWDNLTLQLEYFSGLKPAEIEARGRAALELVGYSGSLTFLPSRLTLFQRRLIALARALLLEPELLICQSSLDGLSHDEQKLFCRPLRQYDNQGLDRTVLFITSYPESLKGVELDIICNTGGFLPS